MTKFTLLQWIAFFYIYCFFGWCFESGYASIKNKRLENRGFLRGPYIPIYAFGAIFVLIITDVFSVVLANEETNLYTFTCKKSVSATDKKPQAIEVESEI